MLTNRTNTDDFKWDEATCKPKTFFRSIYKFKIESEQNKLKAIATFNKNARIESIKINDQSITDGELKCSDLIKILKDKIGSVELRCVSIDSENTNGIFLIPDEEFFDKKEAQLSETEKMVALEEFKKFIPALVIDTQLKNVNKNQAYLWIKKFHQLEKITGILHFESSNSIFFQNKNENFLLIYGNKTILRILPSISLDIDDGFTCQSTEPNELTKDFLKKLNLFFVKWKENQYQDSIFPLNSEAYRELTGSPLLGVFGSLSKRQHSTTMDLIDIELSEECMKQAPRRKSISEDMF